MGYWRGEFAHQLGHQVAKDASSGHLGLTLLGLGAWYGAALWIKAVVVVVIEHATQFGIGNPTRGRSFDSARGSALEYRRPRPL